MATLRQELMHIASERRYDPAARRERYLRERKLLGRRSADVEPPATREPKATSPPANVVRPGAKETKGAPPVTPERVAAMKVRLEALKKVLAQLVEKAKADAGVEPKEETTPAKKTADEKTTEEKPKTAAEKKEEAKDAKERRDKEPAKTTPKTEAASVQTQIESIRNQIEDMRAKLAAARQAASTKKPLPKSKPEPEAANRKPTAPPTTTEGRHH